MKNPERVAELLAALKAECQYRAEFLAVAEVEKTVRELPRVTAIDDEHQSFLGKVYDRTPDGHFKKGRYLHRDVWAWYFGEPPKGYHIHHIDGNPANNNIENLKLLTAYQHRQIHVPKGEQIAKPLRTFVCEVCGKEYQTFATGNNRFCSAECRNKNAYRTQPQVERICVVCGKNFTTRRDDNVTTCSRTCANKLRHHGLKTTAVCEICGKSFDVETAKSSRFCSPQCKAKNDYENNQEERTCVICGAKFSCYRFDKTKTCSQSCAMKLSWRTRKK